MIENIESSINLFIVLFLVIETLAMLFLLKNRSTNKKRVKKQTAEVSTDKSMYIDITDKRVETEVNKAMNAIAENIILNEKQINHAENHDDVSEVAKFTAYNKVKLFNIEEIGDAVYGKY